MTQEEIPAEIQVEIEKEKAAYAKSTYKKRIEHRGFRQFRVRYRTKDFPKVTLGPFSSLTAAEEACRQHESATVHIGEAGVEKKLAEFERAREITFGSVLNRELSKVVEKNGKNHPDADRLRAALKCRELCDPTLSLLDSYHFQTYIDDREDMGIAGSTIKREMSQLTAIVEREWRRYPNIWDSNPASPKNLEMPEDTDHRARRLREAIDEDDEDEETKLRSVLNSSGHSPYLKVMFELAITLGMRQGEIRNMEWKDINFKKGYIHIPKTKTKRPRSVPLLYGMRTLLDEWKKYLKGRCRRLGIEKLPQMLFWKHNKKNKEITQITKNAVRIAFRKLCKKAGIDKPPLPIMVKNKAGKLVPKKERNAKGELVIVNKGNPDNLHFHDLRHEATSRLFEIHGLSQVEVMAITGHRTAAMNERYTHLKAQEIGKKITEVGGSVELPITKDEAEYLQIESKKLGMPPEDIVKLYLRQVIHGILIPAAA
ncbi:MAG: tyrosine-type recombinase/integrase [gamma proteobacterium symbiont of Ctena orbiculata]